MTPRRSAAERPLGDPRRLRRTIRWLRRHLPLRCALAAALASLPLLLAGLAWPELRELLSPFPAASLLILAAALALRTGRRSWSQAGAALVGALHSALLAAALLAGPAATHWAGAPNASVACLLAAVALLVLERRPFAAALLGSMALTVGGVAAIGYAVGEPAAFSWGQLRVMDLSTAVLLVILSPGLIAAAFRHVRPAVVQALRWARALVAVTVGMAGVLFWMGLRAEAAEQRSRTLEATARGMAGEVAARVDFMIEALGRLAEHGEGIGGWRSRADWASDARISLGSFSGFVAAEWIDANLQIRALAPAGETARPLQGEPGAEQRFHAALMRARRHGAAAIAGPFRLTDGDDAFRIVLPLSAVGQPEAFLVGVFSFEASFASLFSNFAPDYDVTLIAGRRRVLQRGSPRPDTPSSQATVVSPDPTSAWSLVATPHAATLARLDNLLPEVALGAGLLVAALLYVVIRLGGDAYLRAWRFEQAVRERTREVEAASAAKDRFMNVLSHELRNPLGSISNAVQALPANHHPTAARMKAIIARQARHLKRLVDDLLDATRIERGKVSLDIQPVSLTAELSHAAEALRDRIDSAGVRLTLELPREPLWVRADATRLAQIAGNLLANAARFTPSGGEIRVGAGVGDSGEAWLAVRDTGHGIPRDEIPLLFEPFMQSQETRRYGRGGLGLGLAIVKGLAEACGGTVEARSEGTGRGAEFVVRLQRCAAPEGGTTPPAVEAPGRRRRILIIDDHEDSAEGLAELLRLEDHTVDVAADGETGLESARRQRPDLVICDLGLPDLDGFDVARALRADPRLARLELVALSGFGDDKSVVRAREAGFDEHLTKPIDLEVLRRLASGRRDHWGRARGSRAS